RRRRAAVSRAGRALRDVAENVDMAERDIVVSAGLDLSGSDRRGTESVGFLGEKTVRHRDIPSPRRRGGHSAERTVLRRMLDQRAAPDASLELGKIEQRAVRF